MFDLLILGMGIYVLIASIRGKGKLFVYQNVKEGMEEKFLKTIRTIYGVLGASMIVNGLVSILTTTVFYTVDATTGEFVPNFELGFWSFLTPNLSSLLTILFMIVAGACIIAVYVVARRMTVKNAPRKDQSARDDGGQQRPARPSYRMPSAAFDFTEDADKDTPTE